MGSHRVEHNWSDLAAAAEEPETKLPTFIGSYEKQGDSTDTSAYTKAHTDYTKAFDCVDHNKLKNS